MRTKKIFGWAIFDGDEKKFVNVSGGVAVVVGTAHVFKTRLAARNSGYKLKGDRIKKVAVDLITGTATAILPGR